jgi:hypothetical protein
MFDPQPFEKYSRSLQIWQQPESQVSYLRIGSKPQKTRLGARDIGEIARMRRVKKTSGGIHLL